MMMNADRFMLSPVIPMFQGVKASTKARSPAIHNFTITDFETLKL
jgi:hypothetical protein